MYDQFGQAYEVFLKERYFPTVYQSFYVECIPHTGF